MDEILAETVRQLRELIKDEDASFMVRRDIWKHAHKTETEFSWCVAIVVGVGSGPRECKNIEGPDLAPLIIKAVEWHQSRLATFS